MEKIKINLGKTSKNFKPKYFSKICFVFAVIKKKIVKTT